MPPMLFKKIPDCEGGIFFWIAAYCFILVAISGHNKISNEQQKMNETIRAFQAGFKAGVNSGIIQFSYALNNNNWTTNDLNRIGNCNFSNSWFSYKHYLSPQ